MSIEEMIIATGSFLQHSGHSITDIGEEFLSDLLLLIDAELERREVTIH